MTGYWGKDRSARVGIRRSLREARERDRKLTLRHRWYAGGIATVLSAALIFTGVTPAIAEEVPPVDETTTSETTDASTADETTPEESTPEESTPAPEESQPAEPAQEPAPEKSEPAPAPEESKPAPEKSEPSESKTPDETTASEDEPAKPQARSLAAPLADIGVFAVIDTECGNTSNCAGLRITNTVVNTGGGPASAADWSLKAVRNNATADEFFFTSGQTRTVPRNVSPADRAVYTLSATADPAIQAQYTTTFSCTTAQPSNNGNNTTNVDQAQRTVSFGNRSNNNLGTPATRYAYCTFTQTYIQPTTINVNVGGDRTGASSIGPLQGVTLRLYSGGDGGPNNPFTAAWATCVSNASGDCTFTIPNVSTPMTGNQSQQNGGNGGRQFWIVQENPQPAGWFRNTHIATGSSGATQTQYTVRTPAMTIGGNFDSGTNFMLGTGNSTASASGGIWQESRDNPSFPNRCGIRVALVVDLSGSLSGQLQQVKDAANAMVTALEGTNSSVGVYTFASNAPATAGGNLASTQVATAAGANAVRAHINGFTTPTGSTNWDRGIGQVPTGAFDVAIVITDGNPTSYGNAEGPGNYTRFREVENGIFSANRLKAPSAALGGIGTRVVALGVGDGVGGPANNLVAISGPTANSDYFQSANFTTASTVLRALALGECLGSLTVVKQVVPSTNAPGVITGAQPAGGWAFTTTTSTANVTVSGSPGSTVLPGGAVNFPITFGGGVTSAAVTVSENLAAFPGYAIHPVNNFNATCTATNLAGQTSNVPVTNTTVSGNPGFNLNVPYNQSVSCTVYNKPPQPQASIVVDKFWRVNGTTFPDAENPFAADGVNASLSINNTAQPWGTPRTGLTAGNTASINETKTPFPADLDLCVHTGVEVRLVGSQTVLSTTLPYTTAALAAGSNAYTITNVVTCQSQLTLTKNVANGGANPNLWDLTAYRTNQQALVGPSGTTGVTGFVTPDARYELGEAGGPGTYKQVIAPNAVITPPSTGTWLCQQVNAQGTVIPGFSDGLNGGVIVFPGIRVRCTATNQTAQLTVLKEVVNDNGGDLGPDAWNITANPGANSFGLTSTTFPGAGSANGQNTFNVRPDHVYTISETGPTSYTPERLERWNGTSWVPVVGWTVSVPALGAAVYRVVNDDIAPQLTLVKQVTNNSGGSTPNTAWTLTATPDEGTPLSGPTGTSGQVTANEVYTLTESDIAGYELTNLSCTGGHNTSVANPTVTLEPGENVTCTFTNDDIEVPIQVEKADGIASQGAGGLWTITYTVTVSNPNPLPGVYTLTDAPQFDATSYDIVSQGWQGSPDTTDVPIAANAMGASAHVYTYVVTANSIVDPVPQSGLVCTDNGGGFFNVATVTYPGGTDSDSGCAVPAKPVVNKTALASVQNTATGEWTISYQVSVNNPSGIQLWYSVTDTPEALPTGVTGGTWTATGPVPTGTGGVLNASWNGVGVTQLATGTIQPGATHTYTVSRTVEVEASVTDASLDCPNGGIDNSATVTNGIGGNTAAACAEIVRPTVDVVKTVTGTSQRADGTWDITYSVVVTNDSTTQAAVYDLDDTLLFGGDIEILDASWTGPTGGTAITGPTWSATLATDRALAPRVGSAGVDTYTVTAHAAIDAEAWEGDTLTCQGGERPGAGGFLNTVVVTVNGQSVPGDDCETPELPTFEKIGVSATQNPDDASQWLVSYELRVTTGGFDSFYSLTDTPAFAPGITVISGEAQRTDTDPDGPVIPVTSGVEFVTDAPIGAADAPHVYTITWVVDITDTFDPDASACDGSGTGFFNSAVLSIGDIGIPGEDCIPVEEAVYPVPTKTVTSTTQDPETGDWTIVYDIDVTLAAEGPQNPSGLSAEYDLTDTLEFGGAINIGSASWTGESSGDFEGPNDTATLATDTTIGAGETHTYTVTVVATVTAEAIAGGTTDCIGGEVVEAGGFLNTALLTSGAQETPVDACSEPAFPEVEKRGGATTDNGDGTWDIEYLVTVTYPASASEPLPGLVGYDLTDAPELPAGVVLDGTWNAEAADDVTPDPTNPTWNGSGTWTVVDDGELTPEDGVHTYRLFATVAVTAPPAGEPGTCADTESSGIVIWNVGTVTSGEYVADDEGCQTVHFDDVSLVKTATDLPEGGSVEPGDTFSYELTVTNNGTRTAEDVTVTDDDLNERLAIQGLTVAPAELAWGPAPGWTAKSETQPNDRVALTIDSLAVGASATITIEVEFLAPDTSAVPEILEGDQEPVVPTPVELLENTACVSAASDGDPDNNCDSAEVPARDIVAVVYTRCVNDAPLLGWTLVKSQSLQGEPAEFLWTPDTGTSTTEPQEVALTQPGGTSTWSDEIAWPGTAFTPSGISIDYPGWRAIEASDIVPGSNPTKYYLPGTNVVMTPAQQQEYIFNGLILDPSELDFAWRNGTTITFTVNPELTFSATYPEATPACFVARHTEVQVEKTASVERTEPGKSFTYTLAVENVSDDAAADGVVITDQIPADIKVTDVTWPGEGDTNVLPNWQSCAVTGQNGSGYGGTLTCELFGPLQPVGSDNGGASVAPTITLKATVNPSSKASVVTNVAVVDYHTFGDPDDAGRDSDDATVLLSALPATGGEPAAFLVILGLLALLAGATAMVVTRRRRGESKLTL